MKNYFLTLLSILLLVLGACAQIQKNDLVVEIDGWQGDSIAVNFNGQRIDTIVAQDGKIAVDFDSITPVYAVTLSRLKDLYKNRLRLDSKGITLLISKGEKVKIKGELIDGALYYTTSQFKDFRELQQKTMPHTIAADSIDMIIEDLTNQGDKVNNELFDKRGDEYSKKRALEMEYIKENPDSNLSGHLTSAINIIKFMECYKLLSPKVKEGKYKEVLDMRYKRALEYQEYLEAKDNIEVGKPAPNFTLPSLEGDKVALSDFKGKWIIIDFWGSWCGWCIKGFPKMKEFYNTYSNRVEVITIACHDKDKEWREAVKKNKMEWVNLFDNQNTSGKYAVGGFPTKILIDPSGIIRDITVGDSKDYFEKVIGIGEF